MKDRAADPGYHRRITGFELVTESTHLDEVVADLLGAERYAVDTEFHRERTYYPKLALVQISWGERLVLIDPLAVDVAPLGKLLASSAVAVMHASSQDIEVLERVTGEIPAKIFDTQIAAAFLGLRSPSLAALHDQLLGVRLPKGDRLTDWLQRPLEDAQLAYAASDVERLLEIHDKMTADLIDRGRLEWAEDEFELARRRAQNVRDPDMAWRKIKEARSLRGGAQAVAQAVAGWRERVAMKLDQPPRYVIPDLAIVAMAQRPPKKRSALSKVRGLDERHLKAVDTDALLAAIEEGRNAPVPDAPPRREREDARDLRPAVTLVAAWLAQFANDADFDPAMVGSRAEIEAFLRGEPDAKIGSGWRRELVGRPIEQLVAGEVALAFDGGGRLALERRSYDPLDL